ncbi:hypothetical protein DFP72DRAFT_772797, partial [Ephemerocybe angulata]
SKVYDHFLEPVTREEPDGTIRYVFVCRRSPSIEVTRARHDESTSNLNRHIQKCTPSADPEQIRKMQNYVRGVLYDPTAHRVKCVIWIAKKRRPYIIIEDDELCEIFHGLNPDCVDIGRMTVSRDMIEIHALSKVHIAQMLQVSAAHRCKLHIAADGWTSPNVISFIGVTVHF